MLPQPSRYTRVPTNPPVMRAIRENLPQQFEAVYRKGYHACQKKLLDALNLPDNAETLDDLIKQVSGYEHCYLLLKRYKALMREMEQNPKILAHENTNTPTGQPQTDLLKTLAKLEDRIAETEKKLADKDATCTQTRKKLYREREKNNRLKLKLKAQQDACVCVTDRDITSEDMLLARVEALKTNIKTVYHYVTHPAEGETIQNQNIKKTLQAVQADLQQTLNTLNNN